MCDAKFVLDAYPFLPSIAAFLPLPSDLTLKPLIGQTIYTAEGHTSFPISSVNDVLSLPVTNVSWTGPSTLALWFTTFGTKWIDEITAPMILIPFKNYTIALTTVSYTFEDASWFSFEPEVDSGSDATLAVFASAPYQFQKLITHRNISSFSPSALAWAASVTSSIGGIFAFLDGVFSLIFGRAIMAILFGSRAISPFGLLGVATRNRLKRLVREQYPARQEDIENGGRPGMAAYISEVAIDSALMDKSPASSSRSSLHSSRSGNEGREETFGTEHTQTVISSSYLQLPYAIEELELMVMDSSRRPK
ncbi:hypothetical protein HWV62_35298 [Athelia sp. TMB]|nr:hypothetical protein HWV62_35298 [Athelia sp. TMB]